MRPATSELTGGSFESVSLLIARRLQLAALSPSSNIDGAYSEKLYRLSLYGVKIASFGTTRTTTKELGYVTIDICGWLNATEGVYQSMRLKVDRPPRYARYC